MGRTTVALIAGLWVIPISILVNRIVPEPYMDEIFHIPQAQQYCNGNFKSWDPMITTPPGLYYLSLAHIASLFPGTLLLQTSFSDLCSTAILRSVNGVLAVLCSILVYETITELWPALDRKRATLYAVILSLYPLHWFFTYLYYTDLASLTLFLAMYLMSLKKRYLLSALLGALAVCIRQTNIIWMFFVACTSVIDLIMNHHRRRGNVWKSNVTIGEKTVISPEDFSANPGFRRRKGKSTVDDLTQVVPSDTATSRSQPSGLIDEIQLILIQVWHLKWELLACFSPFLVVLGAFVAFVYWNGSIVLGAKEAHAVSPHFAQILYFAVVSAMFTAPFHFTLGRAVSLLRSFWKNRPISFAFVFGAFAAGLLSVHFFRCFVAKASDPASCSVIIGLRHNYMFTDCCSIAHPYLLADNRHYPFYIWRKVIKAHWALKYVLVPLYVYSWISILDILGKTKSRIWVLAYFLASAATLVPAPLVEFRYYTIPFFIFMLNCASFEIRIVNFRKQQEWPEAGLLFPSTVL
ncbi:hypothetical protein Cgig2_017211 [Carnegiea gigantea]|uniref:Dol-P-Glc:Glc(2)Man(9)GlcNAc(2)-PP-Dol alpha-1,2-glucosyltransferase n=1 Tax=Carnegiea gigantea TaxID=171969 RepID=A0A9Q1QHX3_9CARY|nr:hypothetical protein Cgig2_017211 [Carnegiea gigantea]